MALMAKHGEITPMPDCAIFADTQSEPATVYQYLDWLERQLPFSCVPLDQVDFRTLEEAGQRSLFADECEILAWDFQNRIVLIAAAPPVPIEQLVTGEKKLTAVFYNEFQP